MSKLGMGRPQLLTGEEAAMALTVLSAAMDLAEAKFPPEVVAAVRRAAAKIPTLVLPEDWEVFQAWLIKMHLPRDAR